MLKAPSKNCATSQSVIARENSRRSKIRKRVEHIFGVIQNSMKGKFIRSIGLVRATLKIGLMNLTYNICRYEQLSRLGNFGHRVPEICSHHATKSRPRSSCVRHALAHSGLRAVALTVDSTACDPFPLLRPSTHTYRGLAQGFGIYKAF